MDAVVLRGLPFDEHDRLVAVGERARPAGAIRASDRDPEALGRRRAAELPRLGGAAQVFESIAAVASGWLTLRQPGAEPESLVPQRVTAGFFTTLRVRPAIGRAFTAENEVAGPRSRGDPQRRPVAPPLRRGSAHHRAHDSRSRISKGDRQRADGPGYEVIGVMPPDFAYPVGAARATDIWVPYVVPSDQRMRDPRSRIRYLQVIARLKPGVSVVQAQAQMDQVAAAIERANPVWNKDSRIGVRPLVDHLVGARIAVVDADAARRGRCRPADRVRERREPAARARRAREREVGVRAALGASRWRLVRQLMIESLVLSAAGTACAIVVAWWGVQLLRASMPDDVPRVSVHRARPARARRRRRRCRFSPGSCSASGPALQLSRPDLANALKDGGAA